MTRTIEVSLPTLHPRAGTGIQFAPISELLATLALELHGARILQLGTRGCYGVGGLLEAYRPSRLVAYEFGEARPAATARPSRAGAALAKPEPIPEPDAYFQAVFAYGLGELPQHWRELLREIARVLAPGGALVVHAADTDSGAAARCARLSAALHDAGLSPVLRRRQPGIAQTLIALRRR